MKLDELQKGMIKAMKQHDKLRKDTISSLIGAIKKAAIDQKCKDNITDVFADSVILKEQKTMKEMISTCPSDRTELLEEYNAKLKIIEEFVPKMMTEDEVRSAVYKIIASVDIFYDTKGALMKAVMPRLKGKADGKLINQIVDEIISKTRT